MKLPGAYRGTDAGIAVNIYSGLTSYTIPGREFFFLGAFGWCVLTVGSGGLFWVELGGEEGVGCLDGYGWVGGVGVRAVGVGWVDV